MKRKARIFKRSVLSLLLCLSLVISPLAGTGLEVFAEPLEGVEAPEAEATEEPKVTEESQVTEEPTVTEEPQATEEPAVTEEPQVTEEPAVTEEPTVTEEPKATEVPAVTEEPKATEAPAVTEEPQVTEAPKATEVPWGGASAEPTATPQVNTDNKVTDGIQAGANALSPNGAADQGVAPIAAEGVYYEQDFDALTDVPSWVTTANNTTTVIKDGYLAFDINNAGGVRTMGMSFSDWAQALPDSVTEYIVEFDADISSSNSGGTVFTVTTSDGYLLKLESKAANDRNFAVNDSSAQVTITTDRNAAVWHHYKLYVDKTIGKASLTITAKDSGAAIEGADQMPITYSGTKADVTGFSISLGKGWLSKAYLDNVVVRAPGEGDEFGDISEAAVSYDLQGHGTAIADKQCIVGGPADEPAAPRADGWVFRGWYKETACTNVWNFTADTVPAEGVTLYARWVADPVVDTEGALYAQTFSNIDNVSDLYKSANAQGNVKIAADDAHGYYLTQVNTLSDTGERSGAMDFSGLDVSATDCYSIEFAAVLTPDADAKQNVALVIKDGALTYESNNVNYDITGGYLFKLACSGANSTTYTVNDDAGKTVAVPSGEWCNYKLVVNKKAKTVTVTITKEADGSAVTANDITASFAGNGAATGLHARVARKNGVFSVDNIIVKAAQAPQPPAGGTAYHVAMENISASETVVDCSSLVSNAQVVKYRVLTVKNGYLVKQTFVDPAASVTVDTTGADGVEITPVFYYNIGAPGDKGTDGYKISLPAGSYDFRIINKSGSRCDVYANDQMLVNNILQNGSTPNYFDVNDIVISENEIAITTTDYASGASASSQKIELYVVPSSEQRRRVQKVYVLGDSLVAKYYNGGSKENKDAQTGWGQVLADYLRDDVEVIDLANSGATAYDLALTAFSQVEGSAQSGDILLLESGYNDRTDTKPGYSYTSPTNNYMADALRMMVSQAKMKDMTVILVSPNASLNPYRGTPGWTEHMEAVVEELNASGKTVEYIDLAQLSFDFLSENYGDAAAATDAMKEDYVVADNLHSKYNAAQKYASLVAGELYKIDATKAMVDTDYVYAFGDIKGNIISCSATGKLAEGYAKVTFSANGQGTDTYKIVETGSKLAAPTEPTASGYVFDGWYKEAACTTAWNFDADTVTADITLYAKWTALAAGTIYTQDFSKVTDASTVATSTNAQGNLKIAEDASHGKYLMYDFSADRVNSRGAYMNFDGADVSDKDKYVVEFDAAVKPGDNQATFLAVKGTDFSYLDKNINNGAAGGYLLNLTNGGPGTVYTMNKTQTVTIPSGEWCHYKLYVDKTKGLVSTTITGSVTGSIADKVVTSYDGEGNVAGLYMLAGRYNPVMSVDNILVREVAEGVDEFGEIKAETLADVEFTAQLNTVISQPAEGAPVHKEISVKGIGSMGGDLTDKVSVAWSVAGLEKDDGYISLTQAPGTGEGTEGAKADTAGYTGSTAYFNVRTGVSNYQGYVQAVVTYGDDSFTIRTPFAVIGASSSDANLLAPAMGYPVSMDDYADSLVGYEGTSNGIGTKDVVLNNWSIYGSNSKRTMKLVKDADGTKALEFASNGGSGSTVAVYQWEDQSSQYVIDFRAKFTADMSFGVYYNTPNNGEDPAKPNLWPKPEWSASVSGGSLNLGSESIAGVSADKWYRIVISADPSIQKVSIAVYDGNTEVGKIEDVDMQNDDVVQRYFSFIGTWPMYLNSFKAYKPVAATLTVNSDADTVKVPDAGQPEQEMVLSATVTSTDGIKMTGAVQWSLEEEYANVELETTGAQTANLKIGAGASGTVVVVASKDGKQGRKEIQLTTSSNVVAFKKSTSSVTIPFAGEEALKLDYTAETRDKDGKPIDGGAITYALLAKDGATPAGTIRGVSFENGILTVEPGAAPAVIYVKASNAEGLSTKVKVNIHGLSFAFGSQDAAEGYTQVADTLYNDRLGYGFADTSGLTVNTDSVTAQKEFRFKAKVPNGNYAVKVDTTASAMKSEVVESVSAATGISKSGSSFTVAVCDGVLDLTFPAASSVKSVVISQAAAKEALAKPYIYAIGDSTANNTADGAKSWGNCAADKLVQLPDVFGGFANHGKAGDDTVIYYNNARLEAVLLAICPGDYVTINMGINSRETGEGAAYETLMRDYYVNGVLQRGGIPVIVTATPDGPVGDRVDSNYDKTTGKFTNNRGDGARNNILRKIAQELDVTLIELGQWGEDWMNTLTADDLAAYNAAYLTSHKTILEMVQSWYVDHNHYKEYLGKQIAWYLYSELAKMAGGTAPERPTLPKPQGGRIIEDFETTTDWQLEGTLAGKFSVQPDGKGGHYLLGNGGEVGSGNAYAKKVFADLPDMETAEISVDWIANSAELKTQDKQAYYALQLWSGDMELVSLYVSDLRGNAEAKLYYSTTGIGDKQETGVTFKQGQTLNVKFALNFQTHTVDIYLNGTKAVSGVGFNVLATKADTFAIATLDDTAAKKKYPNFAIDNFAFAYKEGTAQDLSKLVKSLKPMDKREHGLVGSMSEFVHPTKATVVLGDDTELEVDIDAATWTADKTVSFNEVGTYTWTAELIMPDGYSNPNKVLASYVMKYLAAYLNTDMNELGKLSVVTLNKAQYEAGYSHPEKIAAKLVNGDWCGIEIDQATWTSEPAFDKNVRGVYVWTAQLKDDGVHGNPKGFKASYTMHYEADWVKSHDIEEDFLFGYPGWDVWGKDIDNTSGTGGFGFEIRGTGDGSHLYATQGDAKNRGSRMNLSTDIVKGAVMEFDFMPAVVNGGHVDLLFVAPAYKQNYLSLLVGTDGKVSYHTTEDLDGSGGHPKNNDFDGVISSGSPVATGVGAIGKWMHIKVEFDYLAHTASLTVTSKENPAETYSVSDIPIDDRANGLSIMVLRKLSGCSRAEVGVDNVIVDYTRFGSGDIVKVAQPKDVNVAESEFEKFVLPVEVEATLGDNSKVMVPVKEWNSTPEFVRGNTGTYVWKAEIDNEKLGLTNYFGLSLSFTMEYSMLPFPVNVFNPSTLELTYGQPLPEQFPDQVDAKMSDGSMRKVKVSEWTPIRAFDAQQEGIYVYGATIVPVAGDYDVVAAKLNPSENITEGDPREYKAEYAKYNVYYRVSYYKDEVDNYNGYARTMENLDRGVYAVAVDGGVFVSWRLLATEYGADKNVSFDIYRNGVKINTTPVTDKTNFVDAAGKAGDLYTVVKTQDGQRYEGAEATASASNYLSIPVQKPEPQADRDGNLAAYTLNDMGVADVDGDGEYEFIVKWYPDDAFDSGNAGGPSGPTIFDLYELDGTPLWRLNLGLELPSGAHFNQFMLYDLDEDGKAELFIKTSDGTTSYRPNAEGKFDMYDSSTVIAYIGDPAVEPGTNIGPNGHVNPNSNEYVTVFNGQTGEVIDSIDFINTTNDFDEWGKANDGGNRSARYNIAIAYLPADQADANCTETIPAVLFNRGYYAKTTVAAYTLRNGKLQLEWNFVRATGDRESGKGNHNMSTGDIDKDGFDELIIGAMAIDHDGTVLWVKDGREGQDYAGHADTIHLAAMSPDSNDLYVFTPNEEAGSATVNAAVVNARTGARLNGVWFSLKDVGRAIAANITPRPGYESWSASTGSGIYAFDGSTVADTIPVPMNWRMFWDGDLLSELGDGAANDGNWLITKYDWENNTLDTLAALEGTKTNNHSKKTPGLTADLFGDWREEVVLRNEDDTELRIYMTTEETDYMIYTLMHDPVYRNAVANQNTSYNQPPHVGFYLGEDNKDTVLAKGLPTAVIQYGTSSEGGIPVEGTLTDAQAKNEIPAPTAEVTQATGWATAEEVKEGLKDVVIAKISEAAGITIPRENTLVQEVEIRISRDGGKTFDAATAGNFPKGGVKVVLPYPEGTNKDDYEFTVSHLIVMGCNGHKAGDVVQETVNKTDDGLEMIVKSASPFVIGWYSTSQKPDEPDKPDEPNKPDNPNEPDDSDEPDDTDDSNEPDDSNDSAQIVPEEQGGDNEPVVNTSDEKISTPAKTGDHMGILLWLCIALIVVASAGIAVTVLVRYYRKK